MLTTTSPSEIDTELAGLWATQQRLRKAIADLDRYVLGRVHRGLSVGEAETRQGDLAMELAQVRALAEPFEAEYSRRRWNRYFLVLNSNGHVHRGMSCSTCFPTTEYGWLPELSGCDEAEMIVEFGEKACTVCFPDAPAHPAFHAPGRRDQAAIDARAAEKAARAADKAAKAITAADGSALRVPDVFGWTEVIRTKVAARNALSDAVQSACWYGDEDGRYAARAAALVEALERHGIETAPVIARAEAKARKEGAEHSWSVTA